MSTVDAESPRGERGLMKTTRPKLLLVDDREENLIALEALLGTASAELLRARSGTEALELLLVEDVALALIDVQMPEMDGFELAELMRGAERTRHIPIIFVTAGIHDRARVFRGYESGAVDFLYKPLDPLVLSSKVQVFLQLHRQQQLLAAQVSQLAEAARRKDEFLALLSHELRNPLMPIRNSLYILERAAPGSEQAGTAKNIIGRQVSHLARLVDDLLDVSRITRGKIQLERHDVDLGAVVQRTADDHRHTFVKAGIDLVVQIEPAPLPFNGDPTRVAQVVGNLLGNAAKFTPEGGEVRLNLRGEERMARLQVADTGVGISPELLEKIFEPFAQAERTLARSRAGLGLGLALVRAIAELHGGKATASSEGPGRGATFEVSLPLVSAPSYSARTAPAPAAVASPGRRVLIIEDNPDGAASLRHAVQMMGHEVHVASDGPRGIELARHLHPHFVLCDVGLPGMDGYEVARVLRDEPELSATLVAVTGYALPEDRRRAREAGFAHHLPKPPPLDQLERLLAG